LNNHLKGIVHFEINYNNWVITSPEPTPKPNLNPYLPYITLYFIGTYTASPLKVHILQNKVQPT